MTTQVNDIAIDDAVASALSDGTHVVYSLSGGKDSSAAAFVVDAYLDRIGHPRDRRHAIHADLGMIEWPSTSGFVETIATMLAVDLSVVRRKAGGLFSDGNSAGRVRSADTRTSRRTSSCRHFPPHACASVRVRPRCNRSAQISGRGLPGKPSFLWSAFAARKASSGPRPRSASLIPALRLSETGQGRPC